MPREWAAAAVLAALSAKAFGCKIVAVRLGMVELAAEVADIQSRQSGRWQAVEDSCLGSRHETDHRILEAEEVDQYCPLVAAVDQRLSLLVGLHKKLVVDSACHAHMGREGDGSTANMRDEVEECALGLVAPKPGVDSTADRTELVDEVRECNLESP